MEFSEETFLVSLMRRPEDVRRFESMFRSDWLQIPVYRKVLDEIYSFTKAHNTPPGITTLHQIISKQDRGLYDARYKQALDKLAQHEKTVTLDQEVYTMDQAKWVGISNSIGELTKSPAFVQMQTNNDGAGILRTVEMWMQQFHGKPENVEMDLKESVEHLVKERGWLNKHEKVPFGIKAIDNLSSGGLRPPGVGIIMAPTGHGKSNCLIIGSRKMVQTSEKRVLFITNELSHLEVTERFMSALTGATLFEVAERPSKVAVGMKKHWVQQKVHEKLRIIDTLASEISTDDIEAMVARYVTMYGWVPEVIVIDFMERMKPTIEGYKRDQSWNWIGAVAKDLVRLSKKLDIVVWSACQTNRSGLDAKIQEMNQAQGSIQHFQEAKVVVAMHRVTGVTMQDKANKLLEFSALKLREASMPEDSYLVECNFAKMSIESERKKISDYTQDPDSDVEVDKTSKAAKKDKTKLTPQQAKNGGKK